MFAVFFEKIGGNKKDEEVRDDVGDYSAKVKLQAEEFDREWTASMKKLQEELERFDEHIRQITPARAARERAAMKKRQERFDKHVRRVAARVLMKKLQEELEKFVGEI